MKIDTVTVADHALWDAYVHASATASMYHLSGWHALIREQFGHETVCVAARDARGEIRGLLPIVRMRSTLFGNFAVSMPYFNYGGPVADDASTLVGLVAAGQQRAQAWGCSHLELRACEDLKLDLPARVDKVGMLLELPPADEALWQSFDPKLRSQIRRPQKEGATAAVGREELLAAFYDVFSRNMRDLGTPVYPIDFFRRVLRLLGEQARLVVVSFDNRPVAAGFLVRWRDTVEIPWASSLREQNRRGVNMLLYWESLRRAIADGARRFDFGRSSQGTGTFRFKQQWGAKPRQLHWYYWLRDGQTIPNLTPSNGRYRLAIRCWQQLPLPVANWLGPRIVGDLP